MKCPLCSARKGKRRCPAVHADICPACCGAKRLVEIDCPEECGWLAEGRANDMTRELQDYSKTGDPRKVRRWMAAIRSLHPLLAMIEQVIVDVAAATRDLEDGTVAEALDTVRKGYATETSGILNAPPSLSPRVEMLARPLRAEIEKLREAVRGDGKGDLPVEAVVECLEVTADRVAFHRARGQGDAFVTFLRRVRRRTGGVEDTRSGSEIILP